MKVVVAIANILLASAAIADPSELSAPVAGTDTAPPGFELPTTLADSPPALPAATPATPHRHAHDLRVPIVVAENLMVLLPPAYAYWHPTVEQQMEDWDLHWTWEDWRSKLFTTDQLVLDTNHFNANAMRHPLAGALVYQIGRANGMGPLGSTLLNFAHSVVWEYIAEFHESPSVNDLFSNTAAGFLVGEPLFQIGLAGDGKAGTVRKGIGWIASPFHRAQKAAGLSPLAEGPSSPSRVEVLAGAHALRYDGRETQGEARFALDLELVRDPEFFRAGHTASWTGVATWNRVTLDLRAGGMANGLSGGRFRSLTTYGGRVEHSIGDDQRGRVTFLGIGTGFEVVDRLVPEGVDRVGVFQMVQPMFGGWWRTPHGDVDVAVGASADVAMVSSLARMGMPLLDNSSVLLTRGYYYGTGATAFARVFARRGRWSLELDSTAHRFWSYDHHSYRGDDPKDMTDTRVLSSAALGMWPSVERDVRIELFTTSTLRRGSGNGIERSEHELDGGIAIRAGF